jgi:predicted nucleotidyltransferase
MPTRSNIQTILFVKADAITRLEEFVSNDPTVCFAVVFGSYISTRHRKANDIDIALYFYTHEGLDLLDLINTLSNLTCKEVDLVVLNTASAFLRHQVMKTGIPLIIKDKNIFQRFREKTISDYDEYKFVSGMNVYD